MNGLNVQDGAIQILSDLPEVPVGVLVYFFEGDGGSALEVLLNQVGVRVGEKVLYKDIPLLHDLISPHIACWRIQHVLQSLHYSRLTLQILDSMARTYSALYLSLVALANSLEERGSGYYSLAAMKRAAAPTSWKSDLGRWGAT